MREYKSLPFLAVDQFLKLFVALWNFKHGSQWENPKMCDILKLVDQTGKDEKMGLVVLWTAYVGYFSCPILWVQFGVIQYILRNVKIFKTLAPPKIFIRFQPNFMESGNDGNQRWI